MTSCSIISTAISITCNRMALLCCIPSAATVRRTTIAIQRRFANSRRPATPMRSGCTREQLTNTYDNTILYVDYVVDKAIKLLQSKQDKFTTSPVYLSDHGESLGEDGVYLHGLPYSIAPDTQKHVPMALWLSADYQQRYGISAHCLQQRAQKRITRRIICSPPCSACSASAPASTGGR